jgi:HPt (histidine-containing phosphotransfer) domain-containing protein
MSKYEHIIIDLTYLKEVASENVEFMVDMIDLFLAQTPAYVQDLKSAIELKDWGKIALTSHKLKPTFAFMGIEVGRELMGTIEHRAREKEDFDGISKDFDQFYQSFDSIYIKLQEKKQELLAGD